jgi:hypothetical protein
VIPVALYQDSAGEWKKRPLASGDVATTDPGMVGGWWRVWPDALPGIPLRLTDLVVVDADTPQAVEEVRALRMSGPHSKINTPSGGLHLVFAQPPERVGKFRWSDGIEILGTSSLLTVYDLEELRFPRVAPRAVLPEMFWKPRAECGFRVEDGFVVRGSGTPVGGVPPNKEPRIKIRAVVDNAPPVAVAGLTAALWEMDPVNWRGDYDGWFHLAGAAQAVGIAENEIVRWSLTDPVYAADERAIRRIWDSAQARHGGAFWKFCPRHNLALSPSEPECLGYAGSMMESRNRGLIRGPIRRLACLSWCRHSQHC